MFSDLIQLKK